MVSLQSSSYRGSTVFIYRDNLSPRYYGNEWSYLLALFCFVCRVFSENRTTVLSRAKKIRQQSSPSVPIITFFYLTSGKCTERELHEKYECHWLTLALGHALMRRRKYIREATTGNASALRRLSQIEPISHGPLRFITSHSRFALASAMRKTKRLRRRLLQIHSKKPIALDPALTLPQT